MVTPAGGLDLEQAIIDALFETQALKHMDLLEAAVRLNQADMAERYVLQDPNFRLKVCTSDVFLW